MQKRERKTKRRRGKLIGNSTHTIYRRTIRRATSSQLSALSLLPFAKKETCQLHIPFTNIIVMVAGYAWVGRYAFSFHYVSLLILVSDFCPL